jgi:phage-related tail protein
VPIPVAVQGAQRGKPVPQRDKEQNPIVVRQPVKKAGVTQDRHQASLLESNFREVEEAPPIAKDGVSALMQRLKNIPIRALNQSEFFSLLYLNLQQKEKPKEKIEASNGTQTILKKKSLPHLFQERIRLTHFNQ